MGPALIRAFKIRSMLFENNLFASEFNLRWNVLSGCSSNRSSIMSLDRPKVNQLVYLWVTLDGPLSTDRRFHV